ncbi:MAG: hypothetical protein ACLURP_15215 [Ruminococcus sp.]
MFCRVIQRAMDRQDSVPVCVRVPYFVRTGAGADTGTAMKFPEEPDPFFLFLILTEKSATLQLFLWHCGHLEEKGEKSQIWRYVKRTPKNVLRCKSRNHERISR